MTDQATEVVDTTPEELERDEFFHALGTYEGPVGLDDTIATDVWLDHLGELLRERDEEIQRTHAIAERRIAMVQAWERDVTGRDGLGVRAVRECPQQRADGDRCDEFHELFSVGDGARHMALAKTLRVRVAQSAAHARRRWLDGTSRRCDGRTSTRAGRVA